MQTNDLNALTIPEGNVLSIYSIDSKYPVANTFNPDNYEKETEVKIATAALKGYNINVGKAAAATITLTDSMVGAEGCVPILYDRLNGVVINQKISWRPGQKRGQAAGRALLPKGKRMLDIYVITPEQKIIGPTSLEITVI